MIGVGQGNFAQNVDARTDKRNGYMTSPKFRNRFMSILQNRGTGYKSTIGIDRARGLGQAKASVAGRNNSQKLKKRTPLSVSIDPVGAAMQHAVRNRAVEQGSNTTTATSSVGASRTSSATILQAIRNRGQA